MAITTFAHVVRVCSETCLASEWDSSQTTQVKHFAHVVMEDICEIAFCMVDFVGTEGLRKQCIISITFKMLQNFVSAIKDRLRVHGSFESTRICR